MVHSWYMLFNNVGYYQAVTLSQSIYQHYKRDCQHTSHYYIFPSSYPVHSTCTIKGRPTCTCYHFLLLLCSRQLWNFTISLPSIVKWQILRMLWVIPISKEAICIRQLFLFLRKYINSIYILYSIVYIIYIVQQHINNYIYMLVIFISTNNKYI